MCKWGHTACFRVKGEFAQNEKVKEDDDMFCMRCGNENPDDAVFCRKCGYTMQSVGQQITPPVPEPEPAAHRYASADQATLYGYPIKGIIALMLLVAAFLGLMQPGLSAQLHYVKLEFDAREYNLPHVIQMFVSEEEILPTAWSIENENEDEKQILHFKDEKAIHTCFVFFCISEILSAILLIVGLIVGLVSHRYSGAAVAACACVVIMFLLAAYLTGKSPIMTTGSSGLVYLRFTRGKGIAISLICSVAATVVGLIGNHEHKTSET